MSVLRPLRVVIENYPEGSTEFLDAINNPEDVSAGSRKIPFSREIYIEQEDFMEDPPPKFYRLSPGREVRLRYGYFITCTGVKKDPVTGEVVELSCIYDPATRGGDAPDGRRVKSTLHWVSAKESIPAEVRLYGKLFAQENPMEIPEGKDFTETADPSSLEILTGCRVEPSLASARPGDSFQFERLGYFCCDPDTCETSLIFNRTVSLRDEWRKIQKTQ